MDTLFLSLFGALVAVWVGTGIACVRAVRRKSLAISRAHDLTGTVLELSDELASLRKSLKKLHSRAGMRELRARGDSFDSNDSELVDDDQRATLRDRLRAAYGITPPNKGRH